MSLKTICESMILCDDELSSVLDSAIQEAELWFADMVDEKDYVLYKNVGEKYNFSSIEIDPDNDGSNVIEIKILNNSIHGFMETVDFLEEYAFLNNKIAKIKGGIDDSGNVYKYIRYDTEPGFDTVYDSSVHAGNINSMWYALMQRAICSMAISRFVFAARRISSGSSIFVNTSWGEGESVPEGIGGLSAFARRYSSYGKNLISSYYIGNMYDSMVETSPSYVSFGN